MPTSKLADDLKYYTRVQGANLIVRLNKPKINQYIKQHSHRFAIRSKASQIVNLLEEYINKPEHLQLKKALKDSHYFNGGKYTSLVNELRYGL